MGIDDVNHTAVRSGVNTSSLKKVVSKEAIKADIVSLVREKPAVPITEICYGKHRKKYCYIRYVNKLIASGLIKRNLHLVTR